MSKKFLTVLLCLFLFTGCSNNRSVEKNSIQTNESSFQVVIGEEFLNKFLGKIGKIEGKSNLKGKKIFKLVKIDEEVKWALYNMKIEIKREGAYLYGDADVDISGEKITTAFQTKAEFEYDNKNEKLLIKAEEIRIKKLWNINLSGFYSPEFDLKISNPLNQKIKIKNSDGSIKEIAVETTTKVETEDGAVRITMDLN